MGGKEERTAERKYEVKLILGFLWLLKVLRVSLITVVLIQVVGAVKKCHRSKGRGNEPFAPHSADQCQESTTFCLFERFVSAESLAGSSSTDLTLRLITAAVISCLLASLTFGWLLCMLFHSKVCGEAVAYSAE